MNTAQVTSGHEEIPSWVWSWCGHPAGQMGPTALSHNSALSSVLSCPGSCDLQGKLVQFPLRALEFFFFFFNQCFIHDKEEICVSLEKTECLNEINLTTLLLKLWVFVLGERYEDPHLGLCELSKWGARAQRKQCRPSKQWTLQIIVLLLYLAFLRRRRITAF